MRVTLCKCGDEVGLVIPSAMLVELGATVGTVMKLRMEKGSIVALPVRHPREGWAEAAAAIASSAEDPDEAAWRSFGNEGDDELTC